MGTRNDYEVELVRTEDGLRSLRADWGELYERSAPRNPFLSYEWTAACWEHNCRGSHPFVITARRDGILVGVAALRLDRTLGFRVLRFIGDGRSDYLGFLRDPRAPWVEEALVESLGGLRGQWDLAVLRQLADGYSGLHRAELPQGLRGHGIEGTVAPYHSFPGEWEAAVKEGPGWLKRMAKASRKWLKDGGSVERHEGGEAARYVDEVAAVEARSWKGQQGVGRFQPGSGQRFLREALATLGARGDVELWLARMEGRAVAFEINFVAPERIWLYQGAYDEEFRKYSPGGVLDYLSIERAWRAGAREYDFMSGDEPYKAERTSVTRSLRYLAIHPPTALGYAAFGTLVAPRWRLKGYAPARAALQLWVQVRNNPAVLLPDAWSSRLGMRRAS